MGRIQGRLQRYAYKFNFLGLCAALLFWALSLTPSLLPRSWVLQAIVSAFSTAIGYGLGVLLSRGLRLLKVWEPRRSQKRYYWYGLAGLTAIVLFACLFMYATTQNELRELVEVNKEAAGSYLIMLLLTAILFTLVLAASRLVDKFYLWVRFRVLRALPRGVRTVLAFIISLIVVIFVLNGVLFQSFVDWANDFFGVKNGTTEKGIVQPVNDPTKSGSKDSLIKWGTLGIQGRNFIGRATSVKKLQEFSDTEPLTPVRIYSGLESADSAQSRAALAVKDLERAGGFQRKVILVATTTGSGGVDEKAVAPIEYMYNGDEAIVSMQYSYLPSWLSFLVDKTKAKDAGSELINQVSEKIESMPEEERPKLLVFGESLGSFGSEAAFSGLPDINNRADGVLWAGPPNSNELWTRFRENRDKDSLERLPIYQAGKSVRTAYTVKDYTAPTGVWQNPKTVYLVNPSDPIVWWGPSLLLRKPDWLREPRGQDVLPGITWYPFVTFWQISADLVFAVNVPGGHGHNYGNAPIEAWARIIPPDGWDQAKTDALEKVFPN